MPKYLVLADCFMEGKMYGPNRERRVYHADKPFPKDKTPKHLQLMSEDVKPRGKGKADKSATDPADQTGDPLDGRPVDFGVEAPDSSSVTVL